MKSATCLKYLPIETDARLLKTSKAWLNHDAHEQYGPCQIVLDYEQERTVHNHLERLCPLLHTARWHDRHRSGSSLGAFFIHLDETLVLYRAQEKRRKRHG